MLMRLRAMGPVALVFALGSSLLNSSMPGGWGHTENTATLNPRSSVNVAALPPATPFSAVRYWVLDVPAAQVRRGMEGGGVQHPAPDGVVARAVIAVVGSARARPLLTNAVTVGDLLGALHVGLSGKDVVSPGPDAVLWEGIRVRVIRIRTRIVTVTDAVPSQTLIQYSRELGPGEVRVLHPGSTGLIVRTYRVTYRNGREVARELVAEDSAAPPSDQIELRGSAVVPPPPGNVQYGQASWYDCSGDFAAHLTLPKGTVVTVTNLDNGRTVAVIIDDRGPYGVPGRIIDLCRTAFAKIAPLGQGVANVKITW